MMMEILTLLRANIRHKKGAFKSIIILMFIITATMSAFISTNDNIHRSLFSALDRINTGDLCAWPNTSEDENSAMLKQLEQNEHVKCYRVDDCLLTNWQKINGHELKNQSYQLQPWTTDYPVYNEEQTAFLEQPEELSAGETYVPLAFSILYDCEIGSKIELITNYGSHYLTIKGFVEEPFMGAYMIGYKIYFLSSADYEMLKKEKTDPTDCKQKLLISGQQVHIFQKEDSTLTDTAFTRSVNKSCGIIDQSFLSISKETAAGYTTAFTDIFSGILYTFIILLFVIVLVMICHSISSGIEMDYTNLGILKAMGFTRQKIRMLYILQYMLAGMMGILLGLLVAYPLSSLLGKIFLPITGVFCTTKLSFGKILLIIGLMLFIVYFAILLLTRKLGQISPVRAISGGKAAIYFNSRFTLSIQKKLLSATLAFRQFTANKKHYLGTMLISAILMFFMLSINQLTNCTTSETMMESLGAQNYTIQAEITDKDILNELEEIHKKIEQITPVELFSGMNSDYITLNDTAIHCMFYTDPSLPKNSILKGRCPLYDNEIIITERLAKEYSLHMGDTITLCSDQNEAQYLISGLYQATYDMGLCLAMSYEGYQKIGVKYPYYLEIGLKEDCCSKEVISMLNQDYKDRLTASLYDNSNESIYETIDLALKAVSMLIYGISILFIFVTVNMVCKRSFLKERTDIGIYKAVGFTVNRLRLQFSLRFLIVALIGSLLGIFLCLTCCNSMLELLLGNMGITHFITSYTPTNILLPMLLILTGFFVFSYFASRKIKEVSVKELIIE